MKKWGLVIVLPSLVGLLTACPPPAAVQPQVIECPFPGSQTPAPGWVCDEPVAGVPVSAVGTWEKSKAGHGFMKEMAVAQARGQLADYLGTEVKKKIKQRISASGIGATETVEKFGGYVADLFTEQNLVGSRLYKSTSAPNGDIFVLVGMTKDEVQKTVTEVLQNSIEQDPDKWQEFGASQGQEELIEAVADSF